MDTEELERLAANYRRSRNAVLRSKKDISLIPALMRQSSSPTIYNTPPNTIREQRRMLGAYLYTSLDGFGGELVGTEEANSGRIRQVFRKHHTKLEDAIYRTADSVVKHVEQAVTQGIETDIETLAAIEHYLVARTLQGKITGAEDVIENLAERIAIMVEGQTEARLYAEEEEPAHWVGPEMPPMPEGYDRILRYEQQNLF